MLGTLQLTKYYGNFTEFDQSTLWYFSFNLLPS